MRVMNVKFVGRIIMTILFVFICIGAYAGDDLLKYEIEGEGVGVQGTYLVKVTVIQKKSKLDIDVIKKCAVHGVAFQRIFQSDFTYPAETFGRKYGGRTAASGLF